jgi:hypothetical protein
LKSRPRTFVGFDFMSASDESMMAKFTSGKRFATVSTASAMRKPTPMTRS